VGVVEQSAKAISRPIGERVTTSQVTVESANRATVASKFRGAIDLRKVDGTWLLRIPVFLD
jgi:hypothetical protein